MPQAVRFFFLQGLSLLNRIKAPASCQRLGSLNLLLLTAPHGGGHGFNHDHAGELFADREAGIADLANETRLAGKEADDLVFAEAEFAQAGLHFRGSAKLFDAHGHASLDAAEWTNLALRLLTASGLICLVPNHTNKLIIAVSSRSHYTVFAIWCS